MQQLIKNTYLHVHVDLKFGEMRWRIGLGQCWQARLALKVLQALMWKQVWKPVDLFAVGWLGQSRVILHSAETCSLRRSATCGSDSFDRLKASICPVWHSEYKATLIALQHFAHCNLPV
jgi:hypothetical protein